jgi:hypothetical protein
MDYTFFGIQVAIEAFPKDRLRARLHEVIAKSAQEQSLAEKRAFYKRLTALLNEAVPIFERGHWDYVKNSRKAEKEFDTWCSELEGRSATEAEELGKGHDEILRLSSDKDYVLVTLLFLLEAGSNSDHTVAQRCDLPEDQYFTRRTFGYLVETIPMLTFASVVSDAVYLMPGTEDDGFSGDDLDGGGYEYLRPLS